MTTHHIKKPKGVVYTPRYWADWAVSNNRIAEKWMNGALILDPGCGEGALLEAVLRGALDSGYTPGTNDLTRLVGIDHDSAALDVFRLRLKKLYGLLMPESSLICADYLFHATIPAADIVLANPPWISFADMSEKEKDRLKPVFRKSGLAPSAGSLLLGGSRIDIAALFVAMALVRDMKNPGKGYFFLPLSLFRNDGAHQTFRSLALPGKVPHSVSEIHELDEGRDFPGAGTRYGFVRIDKGTVQKWPIPWIVAGTDESWTAMAASPVAGAGSPLLPYAANRKKPVLPRIPVPGGCRPRQGVNSGGAANVFILEHLNRSDKNLVSARTKTGYEGLLPLEFVHPLLTRESFSPNPDKNTVKRWIFLPYHTDGRILGSDELEKYPHAVRWLEHHKNALCARRGVLMNRFLSKGLWWALLGVGAYSFAPWKIAWEAFGRKRFNPILLNSGAGQCWQGNQAMHAYLPFYRKEEALKVLGMLRSPEIQEFLVQLGGANTKSWAQPGRIRRFLHENQ